LNVKTAALWEWGCGFVVVVGIMNELPVRKNIRLQGYDYSKDGHYFVTVCVKNKHELLGHIVGSGFHARPSIALTDLGIEVQKSIEYICANTKGIDIPQYVIMPNHVHMIIILNTAERNEEGTVGHGSPTLQAVVGRIKSYTAKKWSEMCNTKYDTFWQPRFYDHIIRGESEYNRIRQYINENPANWHEDEYNV